MRPRTRELKKPHWIEDSTPTQLPSNMNKRPPSSIMSSVQKVDSKGQSIQESQKNLLNGNFSPTIKDTHHINPYSSQSPNINEKINFINRLYDEINPTPKSKNLHYMMNQISLKQNDSASLNKSQDTPELQTLVEPMEHPNPSKFEISNLPNFNIRRRSSQIDQFRNLEDSFTQGGSRSCSNNHSKNKTNQSALFEPTQLKSNNIPISVQSPFKYRSNFNIQYADKKPPIQALSTQKQKSIPQKNQYQPLNNSKSSLLSYYPSTQHSQTQSSSVQQSYQQSQQNSKQQSQIHSQQPSKRFDQKVYPTSKQNQPIKPYLADSIDYSPNISVNMTKTNEIINRENSFTLYNKNDDPPQKEHINNNNTIKELEQRWKNLSHYGQTQSSKQKEQMIHNLYDELNGKSTKSLKRNLTKNFIQMNKRNENLNKKSHSNYEQVIESLTKPQSQVRKTKPDMSRNTSKSPNQNSKTRTENSIMSQQANKSILNTTNKSTACFQQNDYRKFLDEINNLGNQLGQTSMKLTRTMKDLQDRR